MSRIDDRETAPCRETLELAAWYPTRALTDDERRRVDQHVADCADCAELLGFSARTHQVLTAEASHHVAPELLVTLADGHQVLESEVLESARRHLSVCRTCTEELAILEAIEREDEGSGAPVPARAAADAPALTTHADDLLEEWRVRSRALWERLVEWWWRPAPAAIYLAGAAAILLVLLVQPGERVERTLPSGGGRTFADGVTLLPDASGTMRGAGVPDAGMAEISAARDQMLLIELTALDAPPAADDRYLVELTPAGEEGAPVAWRDEVRGASFADSYALGLVIGGGTLAPGTYQVSVRDPGGRIVYRSILDVR